MTGSSLIIWSCIAFPERQLLELSYAFLKTMLCRCIIPLARRARRYVQTICSPSETQNTSELRRSVSEYVKSKFGKVRVYIISDADLCAELFETRFPLKELDFVGLDCEWDSGKNNSVALIQISTGSDCLLYRLCHANGEIPINLKNLLEDRRILKFGVAVQEDVRRLRSHGVLVKGSVDLRFLAERCLPATHVDGPSKEPSEWSTWTSLRSLSLNVLNMKLNKHFHIRCGNWEAPELSQAQVLYAAKDAIVSLEIFYALVLMRKASRSGLACLADAFHSTTVTAVDFSRSCIWKNILINPCVYDHKENSLLSWKTSAENSRTYNLPSPWLREVGHSLCQGIVDINYKCRPLQVTSNPNQRLEDAPLSVDELPTVKVKALPSSLKPYKAPCREKPLYENCYLLAPDNRVLATVNRSKVEWYLQRGLGEIEKEDPFTVRLLFEPSGRPMSDDGVYYTTEKDNICVVCGSTSSFVRKMIVPHEYRRYFPPSLKDHMSHDVLLMCLNCHRAAQVYDDHMRQKLACDYEAPLGTQDQMAKINDPDLVRVRSAAKALLLSGDKLPVARKVQLEVIVRDAYGVASVDDQLLKDIVSVDVKQVNKGFKGLHAERVVSQVCEQGKLTEFVRMWRQHFLTCMNPRFLPPLWSIDHNLSSPESAVAS